MPRLLRKWEVQERLSDIERRLYWTGSVGRTELMERFGISPQQASADLKAYLSQAGDTVRFNASTKRYEPTAAFTPSLITPSVEHYVAWAGEVGYAVEIVPRPHRTADPEVLRGLATAIHQQRSVQIRYCSLTHPQGTLRRISPHSLVFNGYRYHVRAYCHQREDFRDFVLGRIITAADVGGPSLDKSRDEAWNTLIIARIGPHPGLTPAQRKVIETDFDMRHGEALVRMRQALLLYFLDQFNLDGYETKRSAEIQQIVLLNSEIRHLAKPD